MAKEWGSEQQHDSPQGEDGVAGECSAQRQAERRAQLAALSPAQRQALSQVLRQRQSNQAQAGQTQAEQTQMSPGQADATTQSGACRSSDAEKITLNVAGESGTVHLPELSASEAPLSFAQARLWLMQAVEGPHYKYNMVSAYRLYGALDIDALQQALNAIVQRHHCLSSYFAEVGEAAAALDAASTRAPALQQRLSGFQLPLPVHDLSQLATADAQAQLAQALLTEARHCFNLRQGPLLRFQLFRLDAMQHVLQMNVHHAIFDGWSKAVLFRELSAAYASLSKGEVWNPPALAQQYADYARWQWQAAQSIPSAANPELSGDAESKRPTQHSWPASVQFWQCYLDGAPALQTLPWDFPRPHQASAEGGIVPLQLDAELVQGLSRLGQAQGASLFMSLLAVYKLLLYRYSGQQDLVVGTPVDLRQTREQRQMIGFFLNTLALRTKLRAEWTFSQLLQAVRQSVLSAFQHQELPFEQVVESVATARSQSFSPLFQTLFVFQHASAGAPQLAALKTERIAVGNQTTKYDLYFTFRQQDNADEPGALTGWLSYRQDLFRQETVEALWRSFCCLLRALLADPQQRLDDVPLLSAEDQYRLEQQAHSAVVDASDAPLAPWALLRRYHDAATQNPAVMFEQNARLGLITVGLTEFYQQAQTLMLAVQAHGLVPGSIVGLYLERGQAQLSSQWALWLLGLIVMPLDPAQPPARLERYIEQAQPALIVQLSTQALVQTVTTAIPQLNLDQLPPCVDCTVALRPSADAPWNDPQWPAYLLFTSGSSGAPKGVLVNHGALAQRLAWQLQQWPYQVDDVVAQRAGPGFVDSFAEAWSALLSGVPLVVVDRASAADPYALGDLLREHRVTSLLLVPSLLRGLLEAYPELSDDCPSLRRLFLSGEALSPELLARCREALPSAEIINIYGATEAADVSALGLAADLAPEQRTARVSIGSAISGMRLHVLDEQLQICPWGKSGELFASGTCLAQGYWRQPALTAQRFLPDPHASTAGARMYWLGDQGRRRSDGLVEYLGRRDHQVKLRGLRLECGEIEQLIEAAPGVAQAAVLALPRDFDPAQGTASVTSDDLLLVAHVALEEGARLDGPSLRAWLSQQLPDYMQPARLRLCDGLPRNASGKLDRPALIALGLPAMLAQTEPPANTLEAQLLAIWSEELKLPAAEISVTASFFELGGHSLLGVRIAARVRAQLNLTLTVQALFQHLSIRAVATHLTLIEGVRGGAPNNMMEDLEISEF